MIMAHPHGRISPEVELQAVKEELELANKKIERYTYLVTTLYDELDTLRNSICTRCKIKLVPAAASSTGRGSFSATPLRQPVFEGSPAQAQSNDSPHRIAEIPSTSSTKQLSFEPTFVPPPADNAANPPIAKPEEADWSVVHNPEVTQTLNVHLAHTLKMKSRVFRVKFSREGKYLAVGLWTGETYIYDMETLSHRVLIDHSEKIKPSIWAMQFSPDDKYVAIGGSDGRIKIWNVAERKVLAMFKGHKSVVSSVGFSPDGRFLVSGSIDKSIRIWRVRDGSSKKLSDAKMSHIYSIAVSPDGRHVAAAGSDGMLRIWDFRSGQLLERWKSKGDAQSLWSVVFTSDGKKLLSGGDDTTVRFWDISSLMDHQSPLRRFAADGGTIDEEKEILTFRPHKRCVYSVSTFPDSRWVLSGSLDRSVSIWDSRTGTWQCTLNGHQRLVKATDTSSDGHHLASGSEDSLVRIWRYEQVE